MIEIRMACGEHAGNVRKINHVRFDRDGFEYKLEYDSPWVIISRRRFGERKYSYFSRVNVKNCWKFDEVMEKVEVKIDEGF